jgi:hypothetical protein
MLENINLNFFETALSNIPSEKLAEYADQFTELKSLLPNSFQMPEIPMSLEQIKQSAEGQVK